LQQLGDLKLGVFTGPVNPTNAEKNAALYLGCDCATVSNLNIVSESLRRGIICSV
jgi:hypothetical protein